MAEQVAHRVLWPGGAQMCTKSHESGGGLLARQSRDIQTADHREAPSAKDIVVENSVEPRRKLRERKIPGRKFSQVRASGDQAPRCDFDSCNFGGREDVQPFFRA